jgi:hypothetical protein
VCFYKEENNHSMLHATHMSFGSCEASEGYSAAFYYGDPVSFPE